MGRCTTITVLVLFLPVSGLWGQSAEQLDGIQEQPNVNYGSAAYIVAVSSGMIEAEQDGEAALEALSDAGFDAESVDPDENARLDDFAHMRMLAHDLPGGVMYTLFPGPRYAYRELRHEELFTGGGDPGEYFTGTRAMRIVRRVMDLAEELEE